MATTSRPGQVDLYDLTFLALRTFEWVETRCTRAHNTTRRPGESGVLRARPGVKVQSAAMKEDGRLQMTPIPEAISVFLTVWIFEFSPSLVALVIR